MTTITTRATKGSALTHAELDANFDTTPVAKSANYTVAIGDHRDVHEHTGTYSVDLPAVATITAASDTGDFWMYHKNVSTGTITLDPNGAETIDGASTLALLENESVLIYVNAGGTEWEVVASHSPNILGATAGTAVASKALVVDANKDIDLGTGDLTATIVNPTTLQIGGVNVTSTAAELNILDGVTSTAAELNILDGVTATFTQLNYNDIATLGTTQASKVVTTDGNGGTTYAAPSTGYAATFNGVSGDYAVGVVGNSGSGVSWGQIIRAGSTSADTPFRIISYSTASEFLKMNGVGGGATGGLTLPTTNGHWNFAGLQVNSASLVAEDSTTGNYLEGNVAHVTLSEWGGGTGYAMNPGFIIGRDGSYTVRAKSVSSDSLGNYTWYVRVNGTNKVGPFTQAVANAWQEGTITVSRGDLVQIYSTGGGSGEGAGMYLAVMTGNPMSYCATHKSYIDALK